MPVKKCSYCGAEKGTNVLCPYCTPIPPMRFIYYVIDPETEEERECTEEEYYNTPEEYRNIAL